ncbi:MAG: N-6 DNA methylase, partial [Oscillospiraceae bacterium]|nr:N-6 DNA methylase [Oscillospiraceae bacterium]
KDVERYKEADKLANHHLVPPVGAKINEIAAQSPNIIIGGVPPIAKKEPEKPITNDNIKPYVSPLEKIESELDRKIGLMNQHPDYEKIKEAGGYLKTWRTMQSLTGIAADVLVNQINELNDEQAKEWFSKVDWNNWQKSLNIPPLLPMSRSEKLYEQFAGMFPQIVSGEYEHMRFGNKGDAFEPLSVEHLGGNSYSFMTWYIQEGDLMRDPDFEFTLDHENKTLNINQYQQDGVPGIGTMYQRVYDDNGNADKKLLAALEQNFKQVLKIAKDVGRELTSYTTRDGEEVELKKPEETDNEVIRNDNETEEINDSTPELREVLNKFSEKHGLGELNIEPNGRLFETMRAGVPFLITDITSPVRDTPHTPETLQAALDKFESGMQDVSKIRNREQIVEKVGGITPLPKVQKNIPKIVYATSPQDKFWENLSALRELKRIENAIKHDRDPYESKYDSRENSDERLSKYSGWGGLSQVFDENNSTWKIERSNLKNNLTVDEYIEIRETTLNAHYTPQVIIDSMYEAVKNMDLPRNARILEPSCGTGNFIRRLPSYFNQADITGVEIDPLTAKIAKYLNPDARILNTGFENSRLDNNDFDIAVGNIPFGDYNLNDPDYAKDWRIHDAFFRKALDKVAPGGVVAFVTSSGTLDKQNPRVREYLGKQADLIGAIRLPNNAFKDAGTKVTADIVFLQKRKTTLEPYAESPDWCYTVPNADGLKINSYFVENPQMVLGKMEKTTHFDMLTCVPFEGVELKEQLSTAIQNLNAKITVEKRDKAAKERAGEIDADGSIKNFTYGRIDDESGKSKYYYRTGDKMQEVNLRPKALKQLIALCELREQSRYLLDKQKTDIPDDALIPIRTELNRQYDSYRLKYGEFNSSATNKIFGNDADCPLLKGLEEFNEETQKWEKAAIFSKRTVNPQKEITAAENIEEALQISLDRRGKPDIHYMATLLDGNYPQLSTREVCFKICDELLDKGICFRDPEKVIPGKPYAEIVERSEYLSGNVRKKLAVAEVQRAANPEYSRNCDALQKVIPEDIKAENIKVRLGIPWIDGEDYSAFLKHLAGRNGYASNGNVTYSPATGEFEVSGAKKRDKSGLNINESTTYGTVDYSLYALAEKLLNQRQIVVKVEKPHPIEPDKTVMKTDSKATKNALEKARKIKEEFNNWIFSDKDRKDKYERKYNDIFNCLVGREYDGSHLTYPGMSSDFHMQTHQNNAVARTTMGGNSLIAHVVGAGKSAVIFASVMRKKELGLINKACVVVPKALTEQTANEWRKLYPDARLLTVSNDDLSSENKRKVFTAKVATGTYDAVILSREQFEKIPMSREVRLAFMWKELEAVEDMLKDRKRENQGRRDPTTKQLELAKKRMKARIDKITDPKSASRAKDDLLEFEHLGFDYLAVDEAHAYKNGFVMTKMTNVAGVTTADSGRAADMQMKCDYFNEQMGNGHILMATGTSKNKSTTLGNNPKIEINKQDIVGCLSIIFRLLMINLLDFSNDNRTFMILIIITATEKDRKTI